MAQPAIIIMGPTGVGKTDFSLQLAKERNGVIINADAFQVYTPLTVGTAKPDLSAPLVPHCLFDVVTNTEEARRWSVTSYRTAVIDILLSLPSDKTPIFVGGSGFYIYSLFFAISSLPPSSDTARSASATWEQLAAIDPARAALIHPNDTYRIERALDIYHITGTRPSAHAPHYDPVIDVATIYFLTRTREQLHARIRQRAHEMFVPWCREAEGLSDDWKKFCIERGIIGYEEIISFLVSPHLGRETEVIEQIIIRTRQYAKRQGTFWRKLVRSLAPYNIPTIDFPLV